MKPKELILLFFKDIIIAAAVYLIIIVLHTEHFYTWNNPLISGGEGQICFRFFSSTVLNYYVLF